MTTRAQRDRRIAAAKKAWEDTEKADTSCGLTDCSNPAIGRYGFRLSPVVTRNLQLCSDCFTAANKNGRIAYTIGLAR